MNKTKFKRKLHKVIQKAVPIWMVIVLTLNSILLTGFLEYYILKKNFNAQLAALVKTTKNSDELVQILKQNVLPQQGYTLAVRWNDIGRQLLESGVIDKTKYEKLFSEKAYAKDQMKYLSMRLSDHMTIDERNSHFMVNTLWALGLVNKNNILDEGSMKMYGNGSTMNYASTGGWKLGTVPTSQLYSSKEIIKLTTRQQEIVKKIAQDVFRPCCGNSTEFPDCNHGMAALGYIEAAVEQGVSEKRIYKDLLMLNSFWFPQQYVEIAALMNKQNTQWKNVDPTLMLSSMYSSSQGTQKVRQAIQTIPGFGDSQGGGCGA